MVKRRYPPLIPGLRLSETAAERELRARGLADRDARALALRVVPVDGRRRTLDDIAERQGYTKGRASQVISRALRRAAASHQRRPLPQWLHAALDELDPRLAALTRLPVGEQPLSFLGLPAGVKIRGLEDHGIRTPAEVDARSDEELLLMPGVGPRSLRLLRRAVRDALGRHARR